MAEDRHKHRQAQTCTAVWSTKSNKKRGEEEKKKTGNRAWLSFGGALV